MVFFIDEEGVLRSHASTLGKVIRALHMEKIPCRCAVRYEVAQRDQYCLAPQVVEESYREGGQSTKTFKGITTTVTYHWEARGAINFLASPMSC